MSETDALASLIARLEAASGFDPILDREIHAWFCEHKCGWTWKQIGKDADGENDSTILVPPNLSPGFTYPPKGKVHPHYHVPKDPVTGSLDAAVKLVPAGWVRGVDATVPEAGITVNLSPRGAPSYIVTGDHKSEPIAMCLAALRARSRSHER